MMKDATVDRARGVCVLLLLLSVTLTCFPDVVATQEADDSNKIRIALDPYPPIQSPTLEHFGAIRIITEAFESEGIHVTYGWFPWKRSLAYVRDGKWDAVSMGSRTPEREDVFDFSEPIITVNTVFFHHKDYSFDWHTIDDLKGRRIGTVSGYLYGDAFEKIKEKLTIDEVTTPVQNIRKLNARRIDIAPFDLTVGVFLLKTNIELQTIEDSIIYHPKPIQTVEWALMFSKNVKKNTRLLTLFNRGLQRLKKNGKYDQYLEEAMIGKYGMK